MLSPVLMVPIVPIVRATRRLLGIDGFGRRPGGAAAPRASAPVPSSASRLPSDEAPAYSRFSLELARRPPEVPYTGGPVIERTSDVAPFLHRLLEAEPYECMGALFLSARSHPIGHAIPFRGTLTACRVSPRPLLLVAMLANAASMICFHQHPSGDPSLSPEDRSFARRLRDAGAAVGVDLRDFVVLGEPPVYWSLREGGPVGLPARPPARPERRRKRKRRKPKYRHPEDGRLTWVGTGFLPVWLREEIEQGATLADFLVDGAEVTEAAARQERRVRERVTRREVESSDCGGSP